MSSQQPISNNLADQLRAWRKKEKLSQIAAAVRIGISPSHLGNLEAGNRMASAELVMRIQKQIQTNAMEQSFQ